MTSDNIFNPGQEDLKFLQNADNDEEFVSQGIPIYQPPPSSHVRSEGQVTKHNILDFGDEGFLLKQLMSEQECKHYIHEGEAIGFQPIYGSKSEYRNSSRIMLRSQELADILWDRIKCYITNITITSDPHTQHIHGPAPLLKGTWLPLRLNPLFRLCKYNPGGHFAPHFDGHFAVTSKERSLQTFMFYLNDDFDAGSTNFVDESQALYKDSNGKYCAEEKNILYRIRPEPGMAIVFNHHRLHEGEAVKNGVKYILRTDILFTKDADEESNPNDEKAFQLVQEAERLEAAGDVMKAMELYRRAFKLSPAVEEACR